VHPTLEVSFLVPRAIQGEAQEVDSFRAVPAAFARVFLREPTKLEITLEGTVPLGLEKPEYSIWLTLKALNPGRIAARIELADRRSFDGSGRSLAD
jgi:hypothetical protein